MVASDRGGSREQPMRLLVWPVCSAAGEMLGILFAFLPLPREHEQRNMIDESRYQATHDLQTRLDNRRFSGVRLAAAMEQAALIGEMVGYCG
jgi:hypothetical protein